MLAVLESNRYCAYVSSSEVSEFRRRLLLIVHVVFDGSESATAKAAGLRASTVHRMVTGAVTDPHSSTVDAMAEAFGVSGAWLRGELSTVEAKASDTGMTEAQWLLKCFARSQQFPEREKIAKQPDDERAIGEAIAALRLVPGEDGFPLPTVVDLLSRWPVNDPRRVDVERQFADIETALIRLAVTRPEGAPHCLIDATTNDEN